MADPKQVSKNLDELMGLLGNDSPKSGSAAPSRAPNNSGPPNNTAQPRTSGNSRSPQQITSDASARTAAMLANSKRAALSAANQHRASTNQQAFTSPTPSPPPPVATPKTKKNYDELAALFGQKPAVAAPQPMPSTRPVPAAVAPAAAMSGVAKNEAELRNLLQRDNHHNAGVPTRPQSASGTVAQTVNRAPNAAPPSNVPTNTVPPPGGAAPSAQNADGSMRRAVMTKEQAYIALFCQFSMTEVSKDLKNMMGNTPEVAKKLAEFKQQLRMDYKEWNEKRITQKILVQRVFSQVCKLNPAQTWAVFQENFKMYSKINGNKLMIRPEAQGQPNVRPPVGPGGSQVQGSVPRPVQVQPQPVVAPRADGAQGVSQAVPIPANPVAISGPAKSQSPPNPQAKRILSAPPRTAPAQGVVAVASAPNIASQPAPGSTAAKKPRPPAARPSDPPSAPGVKAEDVPLAKQYDKKSSAADSSRSGDSATKANGNGKRSAEGSTSGGALKKVKSDTTQKPKVARAKPAKANVKIESQKKNEKALGEQKIPDPKAAAGKSLDASVKPAAATDLNSEQAALTADSKKRAEEVAASKAATDKAGAAVVKKVDVKKPEPKKDDKKRTADDEMDIVKSAGIDVDNEEDALVEEDDGDANTIALEGDSGKWLLNAPVLLKKMNTIARRHGISAVRETCAEFMSLAVRGRLSNIVEKLTEISRARNEASKLIWGFSSIAYSSLDVKRRLEDARREEVRYLDKLAEARKRRRLELEAGNLEDGGEGDAGLGSREDNVKRAESKVVTEKKRQEESMKQTNATLSNILKGNLRRRRDRPKGAPVPAVGALPNPISPAGATRGIQSVIANGSLPSNAEASNVLTGGKPPLPGTRPVAASVSVVKSSAETKEPEQSAVPAIPKYPLTLRDCIFFMEHERPMKKSALLFRSYARARKSQATGKSSP
eukprot:CAMPEP_0182445736 /NCGR_PEP_ID=MMETSP1172-20130603/3759_1 /TAXON_ID=708627 /ORGANISM="Timspurckia oligopyrenoides, Strain CCMP3278" /LENGTH=943 /DNA_ID=CAMNT_0024641555 /DNA_START=241 /DNA_END=3072 /DNA_ORIENTATION=+